MIEEDLATYLIGAAAVTALIGNRLYPMVIPQDVAAFPAAAYQRISRNGVLAHQRSTNMDGVTGLAMGRWQITINASSYSSGKAVAAAMREALDGYHGTMGDSTVYEGRVENEQDGYASSDMLYTSRLDVLMWYAEA